MSVQASDVTYVLGRSAEEERRLQRQARLYDPITRQLFEAAGIGSGMRVLDLGSGAGDVAMLVAGLVGPTGRVVGLDNNSAVLETARRRALAAGLANVTFVDGDVRELPVDGDFDAAVGRLVLIYLPDPAAVLRRVRSRLRPTGVAAFHEVDLSRPGTAYPPSPVGDQCWRWLTQAFAAAGLETAMGLKLHRAFLDAGFAAPEMRVDALIGGGRPFVEEVTAYFADTVRSTLPMLVRHGIATEEEVGIETLAARWSEEILAQRGMILTYLLMGAWARPA